MNWNDLQILLAVQRGGSRAQAARLLQVDKSTISRRLDALEHALGQTLAMRDGQGRLTLTEVGVQIAARAEATFVEVARTVHRQTAGDGMRAAVNGTCWTRDASSEPSFAVGSAIPDW